MLEKNSKKICRLLCNAINVWCHCVCRIACRNQRFIIQSLRWKGGVKVPHATGNITKNTFWWCVFTQHYRPHEHLKRQWIEKSPPTVHLFNEQSKLRWFAKPFTPWKSLNLSAQQNIHPFTGSSQSSSLAAPIIYDPHTVYMCVKINDSVDLYNDCICCS